MLFSRCANVIFSYRYVHKLKTRRFEMEIPTAYFRWLNGSEKFQVAFNFKEDNLNVQREFNFNRDVTENVDSFLSRIKANLEKVLLKKRKKKKNEPIDSNTYEVTTELLNGTIAVSGTEICKDVFFSGSSSELKLRMTGIDYTVSVNCPWVQTISLPSSMMAGFPIYPSKLELLFAIKSDCLFQWFKTKAENQKIITDSTQWMAVGSGFVYVPKVDEVGYCIKVECTPSDSQISGPPTIAVSGNAVQAGPGFCPFETRHAFTSTKLKGNEFRVTSYNILADVYAETEAALNELFPYCPRYALSLDYRKQLLIKEIIGYNSDILCLQEVDYKVFHYDLDNVLTPLGYSGSYSQKGGTVKEGVACFFVEDRFTCLDSHTVILAEELQKNACLSDMWDHIQKKEALKLRVIDRHTALQVVVLKSKEFPDELLIIGNTHLYFHPDADHVRLLQAGIIMKYLTHHVSTLASQNPESHISLIICGDFNSVPECGIYKLMTTKHVPKDYIDWKSNKEEEVEDWELNQPWNLSSACGTPKYTNFTVGFADCLDYIFYQTDTLGVKQVIPMPSEEELREHIAIPSVVFPSDHIALIADLFWNSKPL